METLERVKNLSKDLFAEIVSLREYFHQYPELSFKEYKTSTRIASELDNIGIPYTSGIVNTGIIAIIEGAKPGPTIGIRAELDALPINEETGLSYSSTNPNACLWTRCSYGKLNWNCKNSMAISEGYEWESYADFSTWRRVATRWGKGNY